jgi:hypothetical protein
MSVTVVVTRHPRKLLAFLDKQYAVQHAQPGIYLIEGDTCPAQVIVSEELSEEDNLWLNSLRHDLTAARLEQVVVSKEQELPMDAYFQVIGDANAEAMEELYMRKNGVILTEKLDAYFTEKYGPSYFAKGEAIGEARGKAEGKTEGKTETLVKILRARFKRVPKDVEKTIRAMTDPIALDSWAVHAATCSSMDDFAKALK